MCEHILGGVNASDEGSLLSRGRWRRSYFGVARLPTPKKPKAKCIARIQRLRDSGHALRRPEADYLRDGIYELRVGLTGMNYRMLYFFYGQTAAVVSHGFTKERVVPAREIERALQRKAMFEKAPARHTYEEA
jgi:phage-related protein